MHGLQQMESIGRVRESDQWLASVGEGRTGQLGVNHLAGPAALVPDPVPAGLKQRVLSSAVDAGAIAELTDPTQASLGFRSHMELLKMDGAGTWLHAIPSEALGTKVVP